MIELDQINVTFQTDKKTVHAVKDVSLTIQAGEIFGIVGYSGAGKSTLVRVINLLQRPSSGTVRIGDTDMTQLKAQELREKRRKIGMIFQHFNLMNSLNVVSNVAFPLKKSGLTKKEQEEKALQLLDLVGLKDKTKSYPSQLSGGQKQRVAIARALANDPEILLCDEATSALDPQTTNQILKLLKRLNQQLNLTIVMITHEMQVVKEICHRVAVMEAGQVIELGDSVTIFSQPKKELTQQFIQTATHMDQALETIITNQTVAQLSEDAQLVELKYVGETTSEPLIQDLYKRFDVSTNILYGNIEMIQGIPVGRLMVTIAGTSEQRQAAFNYLKANDVTTTIIDIQAVELAMKKQEEVDRFESI
ncbi:methionine ABC transporter ATP-binding protein [Atopobacter phocae]|uniref:methionine ABC transporter ATP-binding protein n=1 Tax=Atopobacter phocae TaxID=136492 RepID=UPI000471F8CA|nr:ATP-binding cassette domain-containing protein [Atopobacter phocae]